LPQIIGGNRRLSVRVGDEPTAFGNPLDLPIKLQALHGAGRPSERLRGHDAHDRRHRLSSDREQRDGRWSQCQIDKIIEQARDNGIAYIICAAPWIKDTSQTSRSIRSTGEGLR
jgi:hypothetical protein